MLALRGDAQRPDRCVAGARLAVEQQDARLPRRAALGRDRVEQLGEFAARGRVIASTSTGSARQRSSSQVMECSKAADRRSTCGTIFNSKRMKPQFGRRGLWLNSVWASAVDADEVKHGILVDHGGLLHLREVAAVLEVGVGERQAAGAMRLDQHALELDLGEAPLGPLLAQQMPDMADVGLAVAGPALGAHLGVPAHLLGKTRKVRPCGLCRRSLDAAAASAWVPLPACRPRGRLVGSVEVTPQHCEAQRGEVSLRQPQVLGRERGDQAGVGAEIARLPGELAGEQPSRLGETVRACPRDLP